MVKPPRQTLSALLKIVLLSTSWPFMATSFSPVYPNTKQVDSLVFAQVNVQPNPQPSASSPEPKKTSQPTEQKIQENSENSENSDDEKDWKGWLILIPALVGLYLGILLIHPLWLLKLPMELNIPETPKTPKVKIPLDILGIKYRPRVLDAWVKKHLETFQKKFLENETVKERKDYVSLPVRLEGEEIDKLTTKTFSETFKRENRVRLLIWGEGGSGKTTIACQIAKWGMEKQHKSEALAQHLMLPVLIEKEIDHTGDGIKPIMEAIMAEIQELSDNEQMIVDELLVKQLLRQRRILLIIDGYSEMSPETQKKINFYPKEFPANALVVTSRNEENFQGIDIKIKTLRFDGGKLADFIEQYLKKCRKWNLFANQGEFLQECAQLVGIFGKQKIILVLLAKLYADKMINSQENNSTSDGFLDNIPNLILNYLEKLNRQGERETGSKHSSIKQDAKLIAWKCLEKHYKPSDVERKEVIEAFPSSQRDVAAKCLEYFEKRLRLLMPTGYGENRKDRDKIRFALDPLAEYLAALYLIQEKCKGDQKKWWKFLAKAKEKSGKEEIKSFLLAVRDCCLAKGSEVRVPGFVADEIGKLAGLDFDALQKELERKRVKRLARNLFAAGATIQDRVDDLKKIGDSGLVARFVAPDIVKCLKDDDKEVRLSAVKVLGNLGNASEPAVQALSNLVQDSHPFLRSLALTALEGNNSEDEK